MAAPKDGVFVKVFQKNLDDIDAACFVFRLHFRLQEVFTKFPVRPGVIQDVNVSVDGQSIPGPQHEELPALVEAFARVYNPDRFHGDERLIAMAASHHRLTWLHPFRDGNGHW